MVFWALNCRPLTSRINLWVSRVDSKNQAGSVAGLSVGAVSPVALSLGSSLGARFGAWDMEGSKEVDCGWPSKGVVFLVPTFALLLLRCSCRRGHERGRIIEGGAAVIYK